ncbi:cell wall anchor protein [Coraliomargarita sp. W4R72]
MKNLIKKYPRFLQSLVVGSSLVAGSLYADLPAYDGFDYTADATLFPDPATSDGAGGTGWTNRWTGSGLATVETSATVVSFTDGDGNVYGGGSSVAFSGGSTQAAAARTFLAANDTSGADIFFSYVLRITDGVETGDIVNGPFMSVGILDTASSVSVDNFSIIASGQLGARTNNSTSLLSGKLQYGESYLVVGRLSGWDGDSYNTTTVWLNPNSDDIDNTLISTSSTDVGGGADGFRGLVFRTASLDTTVFNFDDVSVGSTWDAVVIPEPSDSSAALGFIGLLAAMFLRRRN